ncbi:VOC family protein [Lentzea tibetensis]|uniref:VOC family protein n=1 Tax=Lentzea tibetensis TaxID=2591470 RepID=A0A563EZ66_9PSEU|nr:VOC family protein [Lentzea tibetensis]TWP53005.1 VOC family protein [Lentzea tibetensis]
MTSEIHSFTIDCSNAYELGTWWSEVLDKPLADDDHPGDPEVLIAMPAGPPLLFIEVPERKTVKNRLHLDLQPLVPRDQEVERVLALGATVVDDQRKPDGTGWVVMADPEGNEFCILRSAAERAATS